MQVVDLNESMPSSNTTDLAQLVTNRWQWVKSLRLIQEQKWINSKMQFDGIDYAVAEDDINKSGIFLNFTQMKCMSAYSQIMSTMMGPNGFPWNIKPTPDPTLVSLGIKSTQEAEQIYSLPQKMAESIRKANMACDLMRVRIADDLVESNWEEKFSRGLLDLVVLGTMIVKGPFASLSPKKKWKLPITNETNPIEEVSGFQMTQESEDLRVDMEVVSPFEFYPDPAAFDVKDAMWVIHRHVLNKQQILELANSDGFSAVEIMNVVEAYPAGNWTAEPWESRIYAMNKNQTQFAKWERYIALEHWGWLSGEQLRKAGYEMEDSESTNAKQYMTCVWTVGNYCIKIAISSLENPSLPFSVCPYERVLYSIWGRSLPEKMKDPQDIVNAAARAMVDNMGIAAGPQVVYDTSRMVNGFKFEGLKPWGVWALKSLEGVGQPPVQFMPVPSILGDLKVLQDNFKLFIQEVTSMPDMTQGYAGSSSGQHNRTASGMSMLFNAANSYIKGIIFNIDNCITKPMIRKIYDWNMQFSSNQEIKGDFSVDAGGVEELISQETKLSSMQELAQIMQDSEYKPYINKVAMLKEWLRVKGFNGSELVNSDEEASRIRQMLAQEENNKAQQQVAPKVRSETSRPDALLQVLQNTEPTSPAYPAIYEMVIASQDAMTPAMQEALDHMKELSVTQSLTDLDTRVNGPSQLASPEAQQMQQESKNQINQQVETQMQNGPPQPMQQKMEPTIPTNIESM